MPPDQNNDGPAATSETSPEAPHVQAPLMLTTIFPTWEDFAEYLDEYQRQTFQVYVYKTSTSVSTRNLKITQVQDKNTGKISQKLPLELKFYSKTLICTHGGKPQYRGKGLRPRRNRRPMECPARMSVVVKRKPGNCDTSSVSGWRIVVTQHRAIHNHPLTAETFMGHPRNRKVENPMVLETVNALRKAGVKRSAIRKYITEKEPNKNVTSNDVNNLLVKMRNDKFTILPPSAAKSASQVATSIMEQTLDDQPHDEAGTTEFRHRARNEPSRVLTSTLECEDSAPRLSKEVNSLQGLIETSTERFCLRVRQDPKHVDAVTINDTNVLRDLCDSSASREEHDREHEDTGTVNGTDSFQNLRDCSEMTNRSFGQRAIKSNQSVDAATTNGTTSLETLRDSNEMTSGSFRLRTSRLEEQNLALYAQNNKLTEQNRQYVTYLDEARKNVSRQDAMLLNLRKSNVNLTKSLKEQSQEIARLKAENARLKIQTRQHNAVSDIGESTTSQP